MKEHFSITGLFCSLLMLVQLILSRCRWSYCGPSVVLPVLPWSCRSFRGPAGPSVVLPVPLVLSWSVSRPPLLALLGLTSILYIYTFSCLFVYVRVRVCMSPCLSHCRYLHHDAHAGSLSLYLVDVHVSYPLRILLFKQHFEINTYITLSLCVDFWGYLSSNFT